MSHLSGYDGEAVGFDSVTLNKTEEKDSSTQTTEFAESGVSSQTNVSKETGSSVTAEDLNAQEEVLKEYPPPLLTEFLRRVVPKMLDQLEISDKELLYNSSDSDEEEVLNAKLFQEIKLSDLPGMAGGDQSRCILDMSWSSAGNSIAVSVGRFQHKNWNMNGVNITCFDFIKTYPLRPSEEKVADDIFVVGEASGPLYLCKIKTYQPIVDSKCVDPVYEVFQGHIGYVLDVAFSYQKPGVFVSASIDSEVRIYDISQPSPLKVINIDKSVSCMSWLPNNPSVIVLGLAKPDSQLLQVFNLNSGRRVPVEGLTGTGGCVVCLKVNQTRSANYWSIDLMVSNQCHSWTPATTEELRVRCRPLEDKGCGDLETKDGLGEGRYWASGNLRYHTAKHNAVVVSRWFL
ncbi:unnamed protein product [Spodoptera exigua]|nr:unnamed protein product [Spodoptera exigua]